MVITVRGTGGQGKSAQENNKQSYAFDTHINSTTGRYRIYVHIFSTESPQVRLYLYGLAANLAQIYHAHTLTPTGATEASSTLFAAGSVSHTHNLSGNVSSYVGSLTNVTSVPQEVTIWIDGTEKTATIGDPNSKGSTMYDSTNDDWGVDGTTEWNTGELNLTSLITWSVGEHYVELRCSSVGGRLIGNIYVN